MEEKKLQKSVEMLHIYSREKLEIVGAVEVLSSTDKEAMIKLESGVLIVQGSGITISKLVPEDKFLVLSGKIKGLAFEEKITKKSLISKVFKWCFLKII